jgi:hypothetical protein
MLKLPTLHLNGTSHSVLVQQAVVALRAAQEARNALGDCRPHGRDFYPQDKGLGPNTAIEAATRAWEALAEQQEAIVAQLEDYYTGLLNLPR